MVFRLQLFGSYAEWRRTKRAPLNITETRKETEMSKFHTVGEFKSALNYSPDNLRIEFHVRLPDGRVVVAKPIDLEFREVEGSYVDWLVVDLVTM